MADSDLDIHINSDGGQEAARDIDRVQDSIRDTGDAAEDLGGDGFDELDDMFSRAKRSGEEASEQLDGMREGTDDLGESFEDAAQQGDGLSGSVGGLGGQLFGAIGAAELLETALSGVVDAIKSHIAAQREVLGDAARSGPEIVTTYEGMASALAKIPTPAQEAATALQSYLDVLDASAADVQQQADDADALAAARSKEATALIELQQARGEITAQEADEAKRQQVIDERIEAHQREIEKLEEVERIRTRQAEAARRVADIAAKEAERSQQEAEEFDDLSRREQREATDPELQRDIIRTRQQAQAAGREVEGASKLQRAGEVFDELQAQEESFFQRRVNLISIATRMAQAYLEAGDEQKRNEDRLEDAEEQLEAAQAAAKEATEAQIEEIRQRREAAEARAAEAEQAAQQREAEAGTASEATKREREVGGEIVDAENAADQTRAEADQARREREERQAREREAREAAVDTAARDLAADIDRQIDTANREADPQLVAELESIRDRLADGTSSAELAQLTAQAVSLLGQLTAEQEAARTLLTGLRKELDDLHSRINNMR